MSHLKRQEMPKSWTLPRKGTKYVVRGNSDLKKGIPILIVLRDMLKIARNRKETKRAIHDKQIFLNGEKIVDEKKNAFLFDVISIAPLNKQYRIKLSNNGKFMASECRDDVNKKVAKIVNKKTLKGKKVQLNMSDGRNILSNIKCDVNDSVLINFKDKKIEKCLPLKENANVLIFGGKYAGEEGSLNKIDKEKKMVELIIDRNKTNALIKQIMVIE